MPFSPEYCHLRAEYAAARRHHPEIDHSKLRREIQTLARIEKISRLVETLSPAQRKRLRAAMNGGGKS